MKRLILFVVIFCSCLIINGQVFFYEGFAGNAFPPAGWTVLPLTAPWSISHTYHAGGMLPEARLQGYDFNGTIKLMSPLLDMSQADTAILGFHYFPEVKKADSVLLSVFTRSGGSPWMKTWETSLHNIQKAREYEVLLTGENLGNPNFQFAFFLDGNLNYLENFYLDNVKLFYPTVMDVKLDEIITPEKAELPEPVVARLLNLGNTTIDEVKVSWLTCMGVKHDSIFSGLGLQLFESYIIQFDRWWVSPQGDYDLKMWISSVNGVEDQYHPNDTLVKNITYQKIRPGRVPCIEEFTTSNWNNCSWFDHEFNEWFDLHPEVAVIKYQMDSPGLPDAYYIPDNTPRREYYGVGDLPEAFCNGAEAAMYDTSGIQPSYDAAMKLNSSFEILSSYTMIDDSIVISHNIFPYESIASAKLYTVVLEKTTTGNAGSNGSTVFRNVVMKMFPEGGLGDDMNFYNGIPVSQTYTADLGDTHIEEFDDLSFVVFIQADSSKEILQSCYALQDAVYNNEDRLGMITINGIPLEGFDPDIVNYNVALPTGTYEAPVVFATTLHDSAWMIISQAFTLPGYAVIDVYPESIGSFKRYIISFSYITGLDAPAAQNALIYPNPVLNGKIFLKGIEPEIVKLFTLDGRTMINLENNHSEMIDVSGINSGIYILYLADKNGLVVRQKIVVI